MSKKFWMYVLGSTGNEINILAQSEGEEDTHQDIKDNLAQLGSINLRNGVELDFQVAENLLSTMVKNELCTYRVIRAEATRYDEDNIIEANITFWVDQDDRPKLLEISKALDRLYSEDLERVYLNYARSKGRTIEELDKEDKDEEGKEQPLGWGGPHREQASSSQFIVGSTAGWIVVGKLLEGLHKQPPFVTAFRV